MELLRGVEDQMKLLVASQAFTKKRINAIALDIVQMKAILIRLLGRQGKVKNENKKKTKNI